MFDNFFLTFFRDFDMNKFLSKTVTARPAKVAFFIGKSKLSISRKWPVSVRTGRLLLAVRPLSGFLFERGKSRVNHALWPIRGLLRSTRIDGKGQRQGKGKGHVH